MITNRAQRLNAHGHNCGASLARCPLHRRSLIAEPECGFCGSLGLPFYGETLSTYLSFTQDEMWDDGPVEASSSLAEPKS
jgi:hypothetical protein